MNYYLFPQIFMSSVLQTLVGLSLKKLYILSQLPGNNFNFCHKVSTETHCFSTNMWIILYPNFAVSIFKFSFSIQDETIELNRKSETVCWGEGSCPKPRTRYFFSVGLYQTTTDPPPQNSINWFFFLSNVKIGPTIYFPI